MKSRLRTVMETGFSYTCALCIYFLIYEGLGGCPIDRIFHRECPGCGCMRAFFLLMSGDVGGSADANPFCIPYIAAVIGGTLPFLKGRTIVQWYIVLTACGGLLYHVMK